MNVKRSNYVEYSEVNLFFLFQPKVIIVSIICFQQLLDNFFVEFCSLERNNNNISFCNYTSIFI